MNNRNPYSRRIQKHDDDIMHVYGHFQFLFILHGGLSACFRFDGGHCLAYRWSVCAFLLSSIVFRRQLGLSRGGLHSYSNTTQACFQPVRRRQQHIQISKARVGANGAYRVLFLSTGAIITGVKADIPARRFRKIAIDYNAFCAIILHIHNTE